MQDTDKKRFTEILSGLGVAYGKELSRELSAFWWAVLSEVEISHFAKAATRHVRTSKFFPTPAEILALIPGALNEHISADEAWAIALESFDESATLVLTQEILDAKAKAQPVFDSGDSVAARMTFKAAYESAIRIADPPRWFPSFGDCTGKREAAILKAVAVGRLLASALDHQALPASTPTMTVAGLIEGALTRAGNDYEKLRKRWDGLHQLLSGPTDEELAAQRREKRERFEAHRTAELARLDACA